MHNILREIIRQAVREYPEISPHLSEKANKAIGGFLPILERYYQTVRDAVSGYLSGSGYTTSYRNRMAVAMGESFQDAVHMGYHRNRMAVAMGESFQDAVHMGYQEAGGELPLDQDTSAWMSQRIGEERTHIDSLFERLKLVRPAITPEGVEGEASARAQGYSNTLDAMYQEARMRGSRNMTLVFAGMPGKDECPECKAMEGKRHRISWILANDAIPRPGNDYFTCQGYNCHHYWMNPLTGEAYSF